MPRRSSRRKTHTKSYADPSEHDLEAPASPSSDKNFDYDDDDNDSDEEAVIIDSGGDSDDDSDGSSNARKPKTKGGGKRSATKAKAKAKVITIDGDDGKDRDGDGSSSETKNKKKRRKIEGKGTITSKSKRNSKGKGKGKGKSPKKERDYGPIEDRTCPLCNKIFSIVTGLAYHLEHRVCQRVKPGGCKDMIGTSPFPILQTGERFVTTFGILEVVKDDRGGDNCGKSVLSENVKDLKKKFYRKKETLARRRKKVHAFIGKRTRRRREALSKLYDQLHHQNKREIDGKECLDEYSYAKAVFHEYYSPATPKHIFSGTYLKSQEIGLLPVGIPGDYGPDPTIPADAYPDRIVECVLIKDVRKVVKKLDKEGGRISQVGEAIALVGRTHAQLKQGGTGTKPANVKNQAMDQKDGGMKIFIKRNFLTEKYNPGLAVYVCQTCGKKFTSRAGFKNHVDEQCCILHGEDFRKSRLEALEEVEEALELEILKAPAWLLPPLKAAPGETKKRKRCKKLPGWIVFDPALSSIYPQTFQHLKLKRGSNNSKFMHKKWDAVGPGRKKVRKSRAKANSVKSVVNQVTDWMDMSKLSVYPGVMSMLFPGMQSRHGSPPLEARRPSRRAAGTHAMKNVSRYMNADIEVAEHDSIKEEDYNPEEDIVDPVAEEFLPGDFTSIDIDEPMPPLPVAPMPPLSISSPLTSTSESLKRKPLPDIPIAPPKIAVQPQMKDSQTDCDTGNNEVNKKSNENDDGDSQKPLPKKKRRRKKTEPPLSIKPSGPVIVDIRPLVEEVRAGRYPSMKVYNGEHINICFHCKNEGDDVFGCEFCANSEHLECVKSKVAIRDLEPDDEFMCHRCIQTVLARRARAERRRLGKLNEAMKANTASTSTGISLEQAKNAAALKREVIWSQSEFDQHVSTYSKCPAGGPGGLICCGACTASYSRFLSETAKEMEVQTLSGVGREVSELLELLHDAQFRLKQALDVRTGNDVKRSMLSRDQAGEKESSNNDRFAPSASLMGIMDIYNGNK